jgi:pSer/pThr/pTyr-binding forkhead associated (FHA) protein
MQPNDPVPQLVVLAPNSLRGRTIPLPDDQMVVGREPACDVRLDDPRVSRCHAALRRDGKVFYIQDLGSTGGTLVNGALATAASELRAGDIITFASVRARFEAAPPTAEQTLALPPQAAPPRYDIGSQQGEVVSNVAGNQYNSRVQQVVAQRDNFLRDIAATKTKARWLIWAGFLLSVTGFAMFVAADLNFLKQISQNIQGNSPQPPTVTPFGRDIGGIPYGLLGWAIAALGMLLLVVGVVLHIVAASRRKRVEREFPLPVPWPYAGPQGG